MELIDKSTVVAEIEDKICKYTKRGEESDANHDGCGMYWGGVISCLNEIRSFINTLEVKEVDLENSMVCKVDWYDGFLLDYTQEQQDELLEKIGADVGDKIRVILIKE